MLCFSPSRGVTCFSRKFRASNGHVSQWLRQLRGLPLVSRSAWLRGDGREASRRRQNSSTGCESAIFQQELQLPRLVGLGPLTKGDLSVPAYRPTSNRTAASQAAGPNAAAALQELLGGKYGEMSTLGNYLFQSFNFRSKSKLRPFYSLVANITAEELGHVELVSNGVALLNNGPGGPMRKQILARLRSKT